MACWCVIAGRNPRYASIALSAVACVLLFWFGRRLSLGSASRVSRRCIADPARFSALAMNADSIASSYRWIEYAAFGPTLEKARLDFLPYAEAARQVLILGEGDGRFLARLLEVNFQASVVVVEASFNMIRLAQQRVHAIDQSRVVFQQIDAAAQPLPAGQFDLAVSHFFLDVFDCHQAAALISNLSSRLSQGALWLLSEFQEPETGLRRLYARAWLRTMYAFFSLATGLRVSKLPPIPIC